VRTSGKEELNRHDAKGAKAMNLCVEFLPAGRRGLVTISLEMVRSANPTN
jgi:hypothetical protein